MSRYETAIKKYLDHSFKYASLEVELGTGTDCAVEEKMVPFFVCSAFLVFSVYIAICKCMLRKYFKRLKSPSSELGSESVLELTEIVLHLPKSCKHLV